ncbi:MAG: hypothetical protein Q9223_005600 [Gallowayella weberi]
MSIHHWKQALIQASAFNPSVPEGYMTLWGQEVVVVPHTKEVALRPAEEEQLTATAANSIDLASEGRSLTPKPTILVAEEQREAERDTAVQTTTPHLNLSSDHPVQGLLNALQEDAAPVPCQQP